MKSDCSLHQTVHSAFAFSQFVTKDFPLDSKPFYNKNVHMNGTKFSEMSVPSTSVGPHN